MAKRGRPPRQYDLEKVAIFGQFKATQQTMADYFGVARRTVERLMADKEGEFCQTYKKGLANLRLKLTEAQVELALKGNATMQIWLGKNVLGQTDKQEIDNTHRFPGKIEIELIEPKGV